MNISRTNVNSLLAGLLAVLTFALALLYVIKPVNRLPNQISYGTDNSPATYSEIEEIDTKITELETLISKEQAQNEEHKNRQSERISELKDLLNDRTAQLEASQQRVQKTRVLLINEQDIAERLSVQLDGEKARARDKETDLTSSSAQMLMLDKSLQQEKDYVLRLKAEFESEKMHLSAVREELDLKKSELVRYKRELENTNRALTAKKRELTISQGKINDIKRKNDLLNKKMLILKTGSSNDQQTSQGKTIVSSPNS